MPLIATEILWRDPQDWNGLEKKEGEFNWEKKDKVFAYLKELNVRVFQIYDGTNQIQRVIIARQVDKEMG